MTASQGLAAPERGQRLDAVGQRLGAGEVAVVVGVARQHFAHGHLARLGRAAPDRELAGDVLAESLFSSASAAITAATGPALTAWDVAVEDDPLAGRRLEPEAGGLRRRGIGRIS